MLGKLYQGQDCSAARMLELVGERWSLLILRDAIFRGYTRFSEFERSLGIASNILAKRLEDFVASGLMENAGNEEAGTARRYRLTAKGEAFKPVLMAMTAWGDRWSDPGPIDFVESASGAPVEVRIVETETGKAVDARHVVVRRR